MVKRKNIITGATLIELLVILVIMAVLATIMVFSIKQIDHWRGTKHEAERFIALFQYGCEYAQLTGSAVGVNFTTQEYFFSQVKQDANATQVWQWIEDHSVFQKQKLPDHMMLALHQDKININLDEEQLSTPQIICDPMGEFDSFQLTLFELNNRDHAVIIEANTEADIRIIEQGVM